MPDAVYYVALPQQRIAAWGYPRRKATFITVDSLFNRMEADQLFLSALKALVEMPDSKVEYSEIPPLKKEKTHDKASDQNTYSNYASSGM